ncbi:MAG: ribokinase [Alphaproteobacteria bacterium]|nr:ribokinase [Alphaproteobacteria bacterium]
MTIFNIGSLNLDIVYRVSHLPLAGETVKALNRSVYLGGKGLNQSVAIAMAGGDVKHFGAISSDDDWIVSKLIDYGVDCDFIRKTNEADTGQAIIYVAENGDNSIVLLAGANHCLKENELEAALNGFSNRDWFLAQNETNAVEYGIDIARKRGLSIAYSSAPFDLEKLLPILPKIDLLSVNEIECEQLIAAIGDVNSLPKNQTLLITKGARGAEYIKDGASISVDAYAVDAVDTTGAGDTFLGYFLAMLDARKEIEYCLEFSSVAAGLQVMKPGASNSIPSIEQVKIHFEKHLNSK